VWRLQLIQARTTEGHINGPPDTSLNWQLGLGHRQGVTMGDLKNKRLIIAKGFLFLLAGVLSLLVIFLEYADLKLALLLGLAIWCFCRSYYFAFYVIEHYVDAKFKYAGLWSFVRYMLRRKVGRQSDTPQG